jgi:hypothetical protein
MKEINSTKPSPWEGVFWLPFMIILTPFLIFLNENNYSLAAKGPWLLAISMVFLALLCSALVWYGGSVIQQLLIAGLIIFFVDIRSNWFNELPWWSVPCAFLSVLFLSWLMKENFFKITSAIFAAFLAVTLFQIIFSRSELNRNWDLKAINLNEMYPARVIHLVLDGHMGIEGIPVEIKGGRKLKERILEFYKEYGFHLFGESYSHYSLSIESIPNMVNFSAESEPNSFIKIGKIAERKLDQNRYFENIRKFGYRINVWESSFLEFCSEQMTEIDNCSRYSVVDTKILQSYNLSLFDQLTALFSDYTKRASSYKRIKKIYLKVRSVAMQNGFSLPDWSWDSFRGMSTLNAFQALDMVGEDIVSLPDGNFFFAHLLLPHAPYAIQSDCSVNKNRKAWYPNKEVLEPTVWRRKTYQLYFDQVECLYVKLEALFKEMKDHDIFESSLIIVHGDHGSRISLTDPLIVNEKKVTSQDLIDTYSTIFSIKLPKGVAKYDLRMVPIEQLLERLVFNYLRLGTFGDFYPEMGFVYLNKVMEVNSRYTNELRAISYPVNSE